MHPKFWTAVVAAKAGYHEFNSSILLSRILSTSSHPVSPDSSSGEVLGSSNERPRYWCCNMG